MIIRYWRLDLSIKLQSKGSYMKKPIITMVVAMNKEGVIGIDNQLPWHIIEDLQYFKKVTLGKPIIMGRKTFESIGKVLPGRKNIVISRNLDFTYPNVTVYASLLEAVNDNMDNNEVCIIGGGEIFTQAIKIADIIHATIVHLPVNGNVTLFPEIDANKWYTYQSHPINTSSGIVCDFTIIFNCSRDVDAEEYCSKLK